MQICRHGDRNIQYSFPTDPWASEEFWTGGFAQLTNLGKEQQYELGQYLRKRYWRLLGGNGDYSANKVYAQSTVRNVAIKIIMVNASNKLKKIVAHYFQDVDRVLMSAEANLAGLYPPSGEQLWKNELKWQPIPIHSQPLKDDYLVASHKRCDRYDYLQFEYCNKTVYNGLFVKYKSLISFLEQKSELKFQSLTAINNLYDTLLIEQWKGKT